MSTDRPASGSSRILNTSLRSRHVATAASLALGLLCMIFAFLVLYVDVNLWEEEGFSKNAVETLQDPAVSAYVSERLVDQIIESAREDLVAAQPVIESAMPIVVRSDLFAPVFERAAAEVHRTLFRAGKADQGLVLDLSDVGIILGGFLQNRRPDLATDIPNEIRAAVIRVTQEGPGPAVVTAARVSSWLIYVLPAAILILFAVGILAAKDRRRFLVGIGLGAFVVALVVWVASAIAKPVVVDQVKVAQNRKVVAGVLDAYLGTIPAWCLVLGGAGALLAAAAASGVSPQQLNARLAAGVRAAARTPESDWGQALRAIVLLAIGVIVIFRAETALRVALAVVGFYVLVVGLTGLVRLADRYSTRTDEEAPSGKRRWIGVAATGAAAAAIAGLTVGLVSAFSGGTETLVAADTAMRCNGHEELCDRPLNEVVFPATHNSMSAASSGFVNANQSRGIFDQLDAGIRGFLIDAYNGTPGNFGRIATDYTEETRETAIREVGEQGLRAIERIVGRLDARDRPARTADQLYLCHIVCELGALNGLETFTKLRAWLDDNPNEVLMIFVQDEGPTPAEMEEVFTRAGLADRVFTLLPGAPWPTLRQLIERDERLLVFAEHVGAPGTWYHQGFELFQETPYDTKTVAALQSDESCGPNRGPADAPLFLLNNWVATYPPKPSNARIVNAYDFLLDRARRCQAIRHHIPNLIAVDFYRRGDVVAVADTLNGVGQAPDERATSSGIVTNS